MFEFQYRYNNGFERDGQKMNFMFDKELMDMKEGKFIIFIDKICESGFCYSNMPNMQPAYYTNVKKEKFTFDTLSECLKKALKSEIMQNACFEIRYKVNKKLVKVLILSKEDIIHHYYVEIQEINEFEKACIEGFNDTDNFEIKFGGDVK